MAENKEALSKGRAKLQIHEMSEEEIDYNVMGSFPASDPPSWTLGISPHKTSHCEFEGEKPSAEDPSHQNDTVLPAQSHL